MLKTALAAAKVENQIRHHQSPAQTLAPAARIAGDADIDHTFGRRGARLRATGQLAGGSHVVGHLLVKPDRALPSWAKKAQARSRVSDEVARPPTTSTSKIRCGRIERLADDTTLRMSAPVLDRAHRQAGRTGGEDDGGRHQRRAARQTVSRSILRTRDRSVAAVTRMRLGVSHRRLIRSAQFRPSCPTTGSARPSRCNWDPVFRTGWPR